jgi:uncharacterized protein
VSFVSGDLGAHAPGFVPLTALRRFGEPMETARVVPRLARIRDSFAKLLDARDQELDAGRTPPAILEILAESRARAVEDLGGALALSRLGTQVVELVIKPIGDACNLNCSYCNTRTGARIETRMDETTLEAVLRNALVAPIAQLRLTWHGGEPMMAGPRFYARAFELAAEIAAERGIALRQGIQTNGTMITNEWAEIFAENDIRVGISIDGPKPLHDLHRRYNSGSPSYDRILRSLGILGEHGVAVGGLAVVPDDPTLFDDFAEFVSTQELLPLSLEILFRPSGCPDPQTYAAYFAELFRIYLDRVNPDHHRPKLFEGIVDSILRGGARLCWLNGTCARHLGVDAKGSLTPCCDRLTGWTEYTIGSLATESLPVLRENVASESFWAAEHRKHPKCTTCNWNFVCNSGCTEFRIRGGGAPGALDPYCDFYLAFFPRCFGQFDEALESVHPWQESSGTASEELRRLPS